MEHEKKKIGLHIRKNFFTGFITLLPLVITALFFYWIVNFIHTNLNFIPQKLFPRHQLLITLFELVSFFLILTLIYLIGIMTNNYLGKKLIQIGEHILNRIPLLRIIYSGAKKILETFSSRDKKAYKQVVLVPFPKKGIWSIGFVTGEMMYDRRSGKAPQQMLTVFVPAAPNPTTGFLLVMKKKEMIPVDMPIDTAFKTIISGGILSKKVHIQERRFQK